MSKNTLSKIFFTFISFLLCTQMYGIKIDRAIVSTNDNPMYIDFWPVVAQAWKRIGIKPTLALIGDETVKVDESLGDVIRIKPIEGVTTAVLAQTIRLLLPIYFEDEVSIISDIDMLPISKEYYVDSIKDYPDDAFIVYRPNPYKNQKLISMCYNVAKGSTFKEVFNVHSIEDIPKTIKKWATDLKNNHMTDEIILYHKIHNWKDYKSRCVKLEDKIDSNKRIDRSKWEYDTNLLKQNYYIDSHMLRPYNKYKAKIDELAMHIGIGNVYSTRDILLIVLALMLIAGLILFFYRRKRKI